MAKCSVCGKEITEIKPCPYNYRFGPTCDECCEDCFESEPFSCPEHSTRSENKLNSNKEKKK